MMNRVIKNSLIQNRQNRRRSRFQEVPKASTHSKNIPNGFFDSEKFPRLPTPKNFTKACGSNFGAALRSFSLSPRFEILNILLWLIHDAFGNSKSRREPFHPREEGLDDFFF
jgi:hypothetical protein